MEYRIRKATSSDVDNLLEMSRRVTNHNNREFLPDEMVDAFLASEYFVKEIADFVYDISVLTAGDEIIGMCRFNTNVLESLMVAPEFQGKGAAKYFLDNMLKEKFEEYDEIELECFKVNGRANRFYQKIGFKLMDTYLDENMGKEMCRYKKLKDS